MRTNLYYNIKASSKLKDERIVKDVGNVILVIGIIAAVILIIAGFAQYEERYIGDDTPINWILIISGIGVALSSLAIWGILVMLTNISTNLKNK